MIIQWTLNANSLEEFFNRVRKLEKDTLEARNEILVQMAEEGLVDAVSTTNRTKAQVIADTMKNFGNVLDLTEKDNEPNANS